MGPILLLAVFLGALTVGTRVASPIEAVRQRQMEFTADASHELRTPLSVIEATTTLALARERDPAWYRSAFERVHTESQRIRRLVEDLLWLARFDSTAGQPDAAPVDLGVLAGDTIRSAADLKVPMVAVTLLHRQGDFRQRLDPGGWQTEEAIEWDVAKFCRELPPRVQVKIEGVVKIEG